MKIEKVSENQIRCTLTKEDLADRKLQISELAYGTESARALFREMMQQAAYQYGFEADDIPLMIEAVPMSADSIVLIITKVEYPEELDTRFSKFSNPGSEDGFDAFSDDAASTSASASADDILDLFRQMQDREDSVKEKAAKKTGDFVPLPEALNQKRENPDPPAVSVLPNLTKLFVFGSLDEVIRLAHILDRFYDEQNTLYKSPDSSRFYLVLTKGSHTPEEFNKVCNILTEYSRQARYTAAAEAYFTEHFPVLVKDTALQTLAAL